MPLNCLEGLLLVLIRGAPRAGQSAVRFDVLPPQPPSSLFLFDRHTPVVVLLAVAAQDPDDRVRRARRAGV